MVYTAATPSLAVLEVLVHLDLPAELLPDDLRLLTIEVPDSASVQKLDPSPTDDDACLEAGNAFLKGGAHLIMQVRSVVVPQEWNALINVLHPQMAGVVIAKDEPFQIDPRLLA